MNYIFNLWNKVKTWLVFAKAQKYTITNTDDIPDTIEKNTFYLIGEKPHIWCGVLTCPCGCGEKIHLNLLPKGYPSWTYQKHKKGTISIHPSIWRTKGCRSHFFIKYNRIIWSNRNL